MAESPKAAIAFAKRCGQLGETEYLAADGSTVHFEFVGILDVLERGVECSERGYEVAWYDITVLKTPSERKERLIPDEGTLIEKLKETGDRNREKRNGMDISPNALCPLALRLFAAVPAPAPAVLAAGGSSCAGA
jgi:hypothetical protein